MDIEASLRLHQRRSVRLCEYDYSQAGAYFVTICTHKRELQLGDIVGHSMVLSRFGLIVAECWAWLASQYPHVELDEMVIMPNHLHGILILSNEDVSRRGGSRTAPTKPLGRLVGAFKTVSTKRINLMRRSPGARFWQRGYYEHVIRHEEDLYRVREYIAANPGRWAEDEENPTLWRSGR
jgi:putative transposase